MVDNRDSATDNDCHANPVIAKMSETSIIAAEAESKLSYNSKCPEAMRSEFNVAIIQAAIEKATDFYKRRCDALQNEQSEMRDPERQIVCDILANGYRDKIIESSRAAHASEDRWPNMKHAQRHHYQAEDGFPCPCGKSIDDPIHIPRINP